jgi:NAD-dependent dihydropyrimidine dehydrogenase PreA subunit
MCEICKKHGKGDKWYFNPKNYSREMGEARKEFLEKISGRAYEEWVISGYEKVGALKNIPILGNIAINLFEKYEEKMHGGQIISLEDSLKVLELCENPALLPCECRRMTGEDDYYCLNFGLIPELYEKANPNDSIEELSVDRAKRLLTRWNTEGMYHLILWSKAPYVTTLCSCDSKFCMGFKGRKVLRSKTSMLKGEYIARIDPQKCTGCRECLLRCQFGAISYNAEKVNVDNVNCFGCGLCISRCKQGAIQLIDRKITSFRGLW